MLKVITLTMVMFFTLFIFSSVSYSQERKKDYKVKSGDILWNISKKTLKKHTLWPAIWEANSNGIVNKEKFDQPWKKAVINPNFIYPNQILYIPNVKTIDPEKVKIANNAAKNLRKMYKKERKVTNELINEAKKYFSKK